MSTAIMDKIPNTMRAVRCLGPENYQLQEIPVPTPGPTEVLVKIDACGICASDVKCYTGAPMFWGDGVHPGYAQPPITPGHELIGTVVALGEGAGEMYGLEIGDRAISEQIVPCGKCRFCLSGRYWICANRDIYGFRRYSPGGMAEYMLFPARARNYKVPREIPVEVAALIEPLACSMHAVERAHMEFGDFVVIAGAGTLGLGMVANARLRNPGQLCVLDFDDHRLEIAKSLGADITINPSKVDAIAEVKRLTDGYGCDVYIEATGVPEGVRQGLEMIRKGGNFVEFSVMGKETTADWTTIGDGKEITIYGSHLGPYCYPKVIDYLQRGILKTDGIVSHKLSLDRFLEGFHLAHDPSKSIKVLLMP
jgi:threonine dehydrogenase-like Zn-dependent dehydrogenase